MRTKIENAEGRYFLQKNNSGTYSCDMKLILINSQSLLECYWHAYIVPTKKEM